MIRRITRHFQAVFDRIRDPLLLVDDHGRILAYNAAAHASLDFGSGDITELRSLERSYAIDATGLAADVAEGQANRTVELLDEAGNRSDAVLDIIDLDVRHRGRALRLVHIRDYTTYRNYERWKDELISMVSHEVKNPLAAMKNSMNLLITQTAGPLSEGQHKLITTSIRNIDRLTRLLDNFLDVSRIGAGDYTAEPRWTAAREFVGTVMTSFKTLFNVHRQELRYTIASDIDRVYIDAPKLEQVLINLLSNATKFTPDGGEITVSIERAGLDALSDDMRLISWREVANLRFIRITVRDTGIGMNEETLSHLFTRYYEGGPAGARRGNHLGLSISKRLVEVLGGTLHVHSELGVGTCVTVTLPEDANTSDIMSRIDTIDRYLSRVVSATGGASFFVLRKRADFEWDVCIDRWPLIARRNPRQPEMDDDVCVWTLGDSIAVAVRSGDADASFDALFGAAAEEQQAWAVHHDGYAIGRTIAPHDGVRTARLLKASLARISDRALAALPA